LSKEGAIFGSLLALIGAILFSTKAVLVKLTYQYDIDTTSFQMLRMLFSLPFFLSVAINLLSRNKQNLPLLKTYKYQLLVYGLLGYYIASYLDLEGLQYINASLERIIMFIYPTVVAILSFFWLKKKITGIQVISIFVCYLGILIAYKGNLAIEDNDKIMRGSLFVLGSAITYSIYLVGSQQMVGKMDSRLYNSVAMCIACFSIIIHNALENGFNLFDFRWEIYGYAFLTATIGTVIPSYMIVAGIKIIGANRSSIIGTIGPISTIILATIFLNESIGMTQLIGTLIVIGGVLFLILSKSEIEKGKNL
jgi:drug/metabolite transporter (DMT)-like permease